MRTTVRLDPDIEAAIRRVRQEQPMSISDAVNVLARRGLEAPRRTRRPFTQKTVSLGRELVDVTSVADALEQLEGVDYT
jgi:hypothetical protein